MLTGPDKVAACVAPSFAAEFTECDHMASGRNAAEMGFDYVHEVAFGADLVARAYHKLLQDNPTRQYIATTCPSVVAYVERYHPRLVKHLAPLVSPMVALARFLKRLYGPDMTNRVHRPLHRQERRGGQLQPGGGGGCRPDFRGIARRCSVNGESTPRIAPSADFDPPFAGEGALFPISRGLLQAAEIDENLITDDIVVADGRVGFVDALRDYEAGNLRARLLEVLCCNGCIMGAGMSGNQPHVQSPRPGQPLRALADRPSGR